MECEKHQCGVLKFGGASVNTPEAFFSVSEVILERLSVYGQIVVVVSAMGNTTDELIALAGKINPAPPRREYDMLISAGERMSIALLAMALAAKKKDVISFTGSQAGILTTGDHTNAKIVRVNPKRVFSALKEGKIVIVAGFQGMSLDGDITTLGRGGSDTSAVALALGLGATRVEFYKDVDGVFTEDPKKNKNARLLGELGYAETLDILRSGARVLSSRCVSLAAKNCLPLHVLPFHEHLRPHVGTLIQNGLPRPSVVRYECDEPMEDCL